MTVEIFTPNKTTTLETPVKILEDSSSPKAEGSSVQKSNGTKIGFDLPLTRAISEAVSVPVIASGGVGNLDHLADGVIEGLADAVLAASIFHFAEYTIQEAKQHMADRGIEMRL